MFGSCEIILIFLNFEFFLNSDIFLGFDIFFNFDIFKTFFFFFFSENLTSHVGVFHLRAVAVFLKHLWENNTFSCFSLVSRLFVCLCVCLSDFFFFKNLETLEKYSTWGHWKKVCSNFQNFGHDAKQQFFTKNLIFWGSFLQADVESF